MDDEPAVCLAAVGLVMGLRDFCTWNDANLPYDRMAVSGLSAFPSYY